MSPAGQQESVRESAAAWHSRLQRDGESAQARQALASWLTESAEHRAAYNDIERAWQALRAGAHRSDIMALRHETALRLTRSNSREIRPMKWIATAAVVLLMIGGFILTSRAPHEHPWSASSSPPRADGTYATGVGQQLPIILPDGSHVTLDTQSELQVAFAGHERSVQLIRGQALFEIAKDKTRPFVVTAGRRRLVAVGTVFDVHLNEQQIKVTMVEGSIRVEPAPALPDRLPQTAAQSIDSAPPNTILITAGEQLISDDPKHDQVYDVNPKQVTSWLRGQVIFDNTSLATAVTELNRYSAVQIKLTDPRLAAIRLSGTFTADRPDLFVEAVTTYYPISIAREDARIIALEPR